MSFFARLVRLGATRGRLGEVALDVAGYHRKRIVATALIVDHDDRLLVVRPTYQIGWTLPGGAVERGESEKAFPKAFVSSDESRVPESVAL